MRPGCSRGKEHHLFSLELTATSQITRQSQQQRKTTQPRLLLGTLGGMGGTRLPGLCFAGCNLDRSRSAFAPLFSFPSHGLNCWGFFLFFFWLGRGKGPGCDFVVFPPPCSRCAFFLTAPSGQRAAAQAAISVSLSLSLSTVLGLS